MGDRGVNGVFSDVTFYPEVIMSFWVFREVTALYFHFMRGLPGTSDHLTNTAHRL